MTVVIEISRPRKSEDLVLRGEDQKLQTESEPSVVYKNIVSFITNHLRSIEGNQIKI